MSGAGFHNPLHNQLHSPRHMCCGDVTIKVIGFYKKKRTFILTDCREYLYISVCIWYEDNFTPMKRSWSDSQSSSGDVVRVFMSSLRRHSRFSVCVQKENARLISCNISACEQSIAWADQWRRSAVPQHVTAQQRYCKQEQVQVY